MKQGALIFDEQTDRYDIRFDLADYYGGLHCGETFDVMVGGRWRPTRIEMAENWYLVGIGKVALGDGNRGFFDLACPYRLNATAHRRQRKHADPIKQAPQPERRHLICVPVP